MKKKSVLTIVSVFLNLALFAALAYFNRFNAHAENTPAPLIVLHHMNDVSDAQSDSHEIALFSTTK